MLPDLPLLTFEERGIPKCKKTFCDLENPAD